MRIEVDAEGKIVIPAEMRRQLGIDVGDVLEVEVFPDDRKIELRRPAGTRTLAGSLREYARGKPFPSREEMDQAPRRSPTGGG